MVMIRNASRRHEGSEVSKLKLIHKRKNLMNAVIVEIRAAEGGKDAKMLVEDQFTIYKKMAQRYSL